MNDTTDSIRKAFGIPPQNGALRTDNGVLSLLSGEGEKAYKLVDGFVVEQKLRRKLLLDCAQMSGKKIINIPPNHVEAEIQYDEHGITESPASSAQNLSQKSRKKNLLNGEGFQPF